MTKLIVSSLDFANATKNSERSGQICYGVRSFLYLFRYFPQALQTNGKELSVEYTQSNTTILPLIIVIVRVLTTTCFGPTCGPSSGCNFRLHQLYYNVWSILGEFLGGTMVPLNSPTPKNVSTHYSITDLV